MPAFEPGWSNRLRLGPGCYLRGARGVDQIHDARRWARCRRLSQRPSRRRSLTTTRKHKNRGGIMKFDEILDRLGSFPENSITFYDRAGMAAMKRYPEVLADVRKAVVRLQECGVEAGMRVGILATNSYEWVV